MPTSPDVPYRCVQCTAPCGSLYLQYSNISHNSLLQCSHCGTAASDVYQTYPVSLLLVDMLLFKRGVYRHLLWNRGPAPLRDRRRHRTKIMLVLGVTGIAVDAFIRCIDAGDEAATVHPVALFVRACAYCALENASLIVSIGISAVIMLRLSRCKPSAVEWSTLPLALAYAYVPALFLLLISSVIWRDEYAPARAASAAANAINVTEALSAGPLSASFLHDLSSPFLQDNFDTTSASPLSSALYRLASLSRNNLHSGISRVGRTRGWANEALLRKCVGGSSALISVSVMLNTSKRRTLVVLVLAWAIHLSILHLIDPWLS